jgi:hypothetical protein
MDDYMTARSDIYFTGHQQTLVRFVLARRHRTPRRKSALPRKRGGFRGALENPAWYATLRASPTSLPKGGEMVRAIHPAVLAFRPGGS